MQTSMHYAQSSALSDKQFGAISRAHGLHWPGPVSLHLHLLALSAAQRGGQGWAGGGDRGSLALAVMDVGQQWSHPPWWQE